MKFIETELKGAFFIDIEPIEDQRGFFARTFCQREFQSQGLDFNLVQNSLSQNRNKGTLRGLHFQKDPYPEVKIVTCLQGSAYDVIVDLRPNSPSYLKWTSTEITAGNFRSVYVPKGFAHGFQTLEDNTVIYYQMTETFRPELASGWRWDDPSFEISWPLPVAVISEKDRNYPDFST